MSVMSCSRPKCENIMCDTYVDGIGYVCNECQEEFKEYLNSEKDIVLSEGEMRRKFTVFMKSDKNTYTQGPEITVDQFFNQYTRNE